MAPWDKDPIVKPAMQAGPAAPTASQVAAPAEASPFWERDQITKPAAASSSPAKARYDAALAKVRNVAFADWDDASFNRFVSDKLQPYSPQELAQNAQIFSLGDEVAATSSAMTDQVTKWLGAGGADFGESWSAWQELQSARQELGREQAGGWGTAAEVAGAVTTLGASAAPKLAQAGSALMNVIKPVATGAVEGALYGAGAADGGVASRLDAAQGGGIVGGIAGAGGAAIGKGIEKVLNRGASKAAARQAPQADTIKQGAAAEYQAAKATGAEFDPGVFSILRHDLVGVADEFGAIMPTGKIAEGFGKAKTALKAIDNFTDKPATVQQALVMRRMIQNVADSTDKTEAALGERMLSRFDDLFDTLPPSGVVKGNGQAAVDGMAAGRQEWAKAMRTKTIEKAVRNARYDGGTADAFRAQFRAILKSDKRRRGFSADEIKAMEEFVMNEGLLTPFFRALADGGGMPGAVVGTLAAGPAGTLALPAASAGVRAGLNRGAQTEADIIRAQVANGGRLVAPDLKNFRGSGSLAATGSAPLLDDQRNWITRNLPGF